MFKFSLVTPENKIVEDVEMEEVVVPAFKGELNILSGHSPLVTTLSTGVLRYKPKGSSDFQSAAISWGYLEVGTNGVSVLAETAEVGEAIDKQRAEEALKKAQEGLKDRDLEPNQIVTLQRKIKRAETRLKIASNNKRVDPQFADR